MKKLLHIALTLVLTMTFIVMGSGVTFHHCSCSGKTTMTLTHTSQEEHNSKSTKGCMTTSSLYLSPSTQMQPTAFDFHAFQPLIAIINEWRHFILIPQPMRENEKVLTTLMLGSPPRQYLRILRVLTI